MQTRSLIARSIRHYWRTHLGVVLGAALATLVLTGALMVGDSVKATLRAQAEARVGSIGEALLCGERFVPWSAAPEKKPLVVARMFYPGPHAAGVLLMQGVAARPDGSSRANRVQLVGVDDAFWKLSPSGASIPLAADEIALNERLAQQLGVAAGAEVILRLEKPGAFSKDAPLSGEEEDIVSLRIRVARVVGDAHFGRFALTSGQVPPFTAFIPLAALQEKAGIGEKVNVVLAASKHTAAAPGDTSAQLQSPAADFPSDLEVKALPGNAGIEIRTPRVFLDPAIVAAARANEKSAPHPPPTQIRNPPPGLDSLTYFVNELRLGDGSDPIAPATPYSMVTALDAPASGFVQAELADDEIQITRWLAEDLGAKPGDKITIRYFAMGERRQLVEQARTFTVLAPIIEMNEPRLDSSWMPDFPDLADKENCRDWKPGFDFHPERMRDKDQDYWTKFRGTPKAFLNLKIGQEMWGNRWGSLTSIRYPAGTEREHVEQTATFIDPAALGFHIANLRGDALAATDAPVDFGQLFVSFSFFLIAAAAVLTGLLFTFSIEQRAAEAGLLLAVGWHRRQVRRLFMKEGALLALIGSLAGSAAAALYTKAVLAALAGAWSGATGGTAFLFAPTAATFGIGIASGVLVALAAMALASRRLFKKEAATLLAGEVAGETAPNPETDKQEKRAGSPWHRLPGLLGYLVTGIIGLEVLYLLFVAKAASPMLFFGLGFALLGLGIWWARSILMRASFSTTMRTGGDLALRNTTRRRGRSLATIAVLASGVFMVVAVDSFRKDAAADATRRDSGTGGFALIGESASPIYEDLNSEKGREQYALDDKIMEGVRVLQMRVRDGDDASCLNLNRAVQPRVIGAPFDEMSNTGDPVPGRSHPFGLQWPGVAAKDTTAIPGVVDANTLQWAMQRKLGDTLEIPGERGGAARIEVSGTVPASILQGMVLIPEARFVQSFPNEAGYRFFLVDCPPEKTQAVREHLTRQLGDRGLELVSTAQRLAEFNAVENTYLSIFQVLGALGMLLGSAGVGIVVARNVLERRREFGLLEAVGFTAAQLRALVFAEHRWLIAGALAIGAGSAIIAVWPQLSQKGADVPWMQTTLLFGGVALIGIACAWAATRLALRGSQLAALRSE